MPGTFSPSPRTFWLPLLKKERPSEATRVLKSKVRAVVENLMAAIYIVFVGFGMRDMRYGG